LILKKLKKNVNGKKGSDITEAPSDYLGPWAPYESLTGPMHPPEGYIETQSEENISLKEVRKKAKLEKKKIKEEEQKAKADAEAAKKAEEKTEKTKEEEEAKKDTGDEADTAKVGEERSILHVEDIRDYQGRSFVAPPTHLKNIPHDTFMPKKLIHTWVGHTKGVSCTRFFPNSGHLLLSASMDTTVKIWDVLDDKSCIRTYMGHGQAVRDAAFSHDGTEFLSASYDRKIRLWNTETGQCICTFTNGKIPYVVRYNPERHHDFLSGGSDKKIIQWDIRSKHITQEYDQHLGAVNSVCFIDDNRRFVSSSDDKSLRIWEYGIPVVIKYISEPHMHSMPSIALHPSGAWFLCQSLDNQIIVYNTRDRFKLNKKKRFTGHMAAGYACQVNASPDGKYVISGDAEGNVWFWDWKSCKIYKKIKAHDGVCIGVEWHPIEPSKVVTCGWDGRINYWD